MVYRKATAVVALAGLVASSAPCFAFTGLGCPDLPEHLRAIGTIENGEGSCGMSMAEARRILARDQGAESGQPAPTTRAHRKHHHRRATPER